MSDNRNDSKNESVGNLQRSIQHEQDHKDQQSAGSKHADKPAVQTSARSQPGAPLPAQHLAKPGSEAQMQLKPRFLAPDYSGSGKLAGMVAIVTGGDSGIGRAVAVLYAREGADVAIIYLNEHEDANETRRYVEAEGQSCLLIPGDVREQRFCEEAVSQVMAKFNHIDVLVNNAAFQEHAASLLDLSEERFDLTMKTNVYGYFHMAKAVLPHLQRGASIINTGSVTGLKGSKHLLDYSTTKGAIHAFTMALAGNLLEKGIRVNAVAPGPVWTPLNPADQPPEKISTFGQDTSMHRPAQPEELSPAYVFLASPACSSYITGIVLPVTGSVGE
ncbi:MULTISPECIES: SDR family oxidoreductase [unclassified Janthinobacterium]|uniref:SDR family oxidoreductase n=1 Tax=unclassified Janthinobacterium TaxID=2610881 RepID=UPI0016214FA2|nr:MULTISPECIES: SDR family oxidoreductase [unclassified Janthinobacterium]MBB5609905.1 NAD(P)-dependent dehydrogenase (short-subunit alcohol dehydrogenase family) [Janthinobacterium sp. S3T4]MBB5615171.1 NAD(P)-dependent dehydrogenase (short-subunit alcohol dehydrogenase family) [Janthinobacterium sp. S3M3]